MSHRTFREDFVLYEKIVTKGGRTVYRALPERRVEVSPELANALFLVLVGATVTNLEKNLPGHSRTLREIQSVEQSLRVIAAGPYFDKSLLPLAWGMFNAALLFVEEEAGAV